MIISRTPFRVSFVGGGTDLKSFYEHEDGMVLSTTIDKYIYVTVHRQVGIVESKYRIGWSKVEFKDEIDDIEHPIVRETLRLMKIDFPVEITTFADVPGYTGLGSSSSFAVGLLHALFALKGEMVTKNKLAIMAAKIEINLLNRSIGAQDHFAASYGGMNIFTFHKNETVSVEPVFCRANVLDALSKNLMLFYTNIKRDASEILTVQSAETLKKLDILKGMKKLVMPLSQILSKGSNINEVGDILHKGWQLKKSITSEISSAKIDEHYNLALNAGALGGKLLGAGGGGFLMLYVEPDNQKAVCNALSDLYLLGFKFDTGGTRITYYDQTI
jgi:D-glycero-alpha-D-manno-heptose-7-phosphate kinase